MKGDLEQIEIEPHEHIEDRDRARRIKHDVVPEGTQPTVKEENIKPKQRQDNKIHRAEKHPLLPVLSDTVKIVGKNEYRITAHKPAQNVCRTDVLNSEGQKQEQRADTDSDVNANRVIGDHVSRSAEKVEKQRGLRVVSDHRRAVDGRQHRIRGNRCSRRVEIQGT